MADVPTPLPAAGSTSWYQHYADLDAATRAAQTVAAADSTYALKGEVPALALRANTVALLGTSITDANAPYDQGGGAMSYRGNGYWYWANAVLRQDAAMILEAGVSGNTTGQMLARVQSVIDSGAAICVVETGPNDVMGDSTAATITDNLTGIYEQLQAAGVLVFAGQICPTTTIGSSAARRGVLHEVNRWISQYARTHPGVIPVPWSGPMSDPTTGGPLAGTLHDGTHPNTTGAAVMGRVLANTMRAYVAVSEWMPSTNADPTNGLPNALMQGDTGGVATSWSVVNQGGTAVFTPSKVARTDGGGDWQQVALTSGQVRVISLAPSGTVWTPGSTVQAEMEVEGDFTNATALVLYCQALNSGGTVLQQSLGLEDYHSSPRRIPLAGAVIRSHPLVVPASNTANVAVQFRVIGQATFRVGRASLRAV